MSFSVVRKSNIILAGAEKCRTAIGGLKLDIMSAFAMSTITLFPFSAFGFDPFGSSSMMDRIEDAADASFAFGDFLSELGVESDSDKEVQSSVDRLRRINSDIKSGVSDSQDITDALSGDITKGENIQKKLKSMKNVVQASKRLAILMGLRPRTAGKSIMLQDIQINSMILEELQSMHKAQYLSYLEDKEAKMKREIFMREILASSKRKR